MATASRDIGTPKPGVLSLIKATWSDFSRDECGTRAAALAYSTIFALTPLLILLITIAGFVLDPQDVQKAMETQLGGLIGSDGARAVHDMIASADRPGGANIFKTVLSVAGLLFGATGAFIALQGALNHAWEVKPDPKQGGIMQFITKRLFSIGMVLGIGFLLAVSMALTAGISAIGQRLGGGVAEPVMYVVELVLSFAVLTVLFAAIYKLLPDAQVAWRDVWVGAAVTGLLFVAGKFALGFYLGRSEPGSAFGAAGALAAMLVWVYYAGMILLFGAEFTQRWAESRGHAIQPEKGAVRVKKEEIEQPAGEPKDTDDAREERPPRDRAANKKAESDGRDERPRPRREVVPVRAADGGAANGAQTSGGRLIDRVADRAILLAIGGVLVKRLFTDAKDRRPER